MIRAGVVVGLRSRNCDLNDYTADGVIGRDNQKTFNEKFMNLMSLIQQKGKERDASQTDGESVNGLVRSRTKFSPNGPYQAQATLSCDTYKKSKFECPHCRAEDQTYDASALRAAVITPPDTDSSPLYVRRQ
jgi:hypothetical protein